MVDVWVGRGLYFAPFHLDFTFLFQNALHDFFHLQRAKNSDKQFLKSCDVMLQAHVTSDT